MKNDGWKPTHLYLLFLLNPLYLNYYSYYHFPYPVTQKATGFIHL